MASVKIYPRPILSTPGTSGSTASHANGHSEQYPPQTFLIGYLLTEVMICQKHGSQLCGVAGVAQDTTAKGRLKKAMKTVRAVTRMSLMLKNGGEVRTAESAWN